MPKTVVFTNVSWINNQPYSTKFNDIYFSSDDGIAESRHIFITQNNLENRFQSLQNETFTIAETGFGSGLNFLCAYQTWQKHAPLTAKLHFISCEKYPMNPIDFELALKVWDGSHVTANELIKRYQSINFNNKKASLSFNQVSLTLLLDDACQALSALTLNDKIDAWFLDGFSPAKNPEMWSVSLFTQIALLSKTKTTFATFTSAGFVRRGLQAVGFNVKKVSGFGKKREMLTGHFLYAE